MVLNGFNLNELSGNSEFHAPLMISFHIVKIKITSYFKDEKKIWHRYSKRFQQEEAFLNVSLNNTLMQ